MGQLLKWREADISAATQPCLAFSVDVEMRKESETGNTTSYYANPSVISDNEAA